MSDRQGCPLRSSCLPPRSERRFVQLSVYEREFQQAEMRLRTARYHRLARRRRTVEGVFAARVPGSGGKVQGRTDRPW
ncbi:transposase [Thermaerobacter composti]|uniref:transposase n=1 Tax=Thermaerobacter composti TaxID=554949 RepID=UPI0039A0FEAE